MFFFFFSSRRRHTRSDRDWSSDVCSSDLSRLPGERHERPALSRDDLPHKPVRRERGQVGREAEPGAQLEPARRIGLHDLRLLSDVAAGLPDDALAGREVAIDFEHEIPVVSALLGDLLPHGVRRGAHVKLVLHLRHDASRPTVCTSRTPSIFSIRRESWASESISTVADTMAVLSSWTFTSSADMLTWVSAMTVAMSRIRP